VNDRSGGSPEHEALLLGQPSASELAERLLRPTWQSARHYRALLALSGLAASLLPIGMAYTFASGVGTWGNNIPVAWGFGIVNFVFWIGLGHAGTFISAFLYLMNQSWRASINRMAEAMTLFAVLNAALFPLLHLGRPWFAYWLVPYPSTLGVWPQFRSALVWDLFAVFTYLTTSALFFYLGLLPDLAAMRDRGPSLFWRRVYGVLALGFRGSARQWLHYRSAYGLLAGLATALVISVHTIVSFDFAITLLPGWHSTIFPPYFVVGAIYSGFALVIALLLPARRAFGFQSIVTARHLELLAKVLLAMSLLIAYSYATELYAAARADDEPERRMLLEVRPFGHYAILYWLMLGANVLVPQLLWFARVRRRKGVLMLIALVVVAGMWLERFVLIVTSQSRDFLPSSFGDFVPTPVDAAILLGSGGLFAFLFLLFLRFLPFSAIHELKELAREKELEAGRG
jgi:molybdopterin-containing oxidoreductase family membrane subunit